MMMMKLIMIRIKMILTLDDDTDDTDYGRMMLMILWICDDVIFTSFFITNDALY
jgi:hypothetical protein